VIVNTFLLCGRKPFSSHPHEEGFDGEMSEEYPLLKFRHVLEDVQRKFEELTVVYMCPFCSYISYDPLPHSKEIVHVWWETDEDDRPHSADLKVDFCRCPTCKTEPPKAMRSLDFHRTRFKQYVYRMPTENYKKRVEEVKQLLNEELKNIWVTDEITYRGNAFEDLLSMQPEVARLVKIAFSRLIQQSGLVKTT
jgi:hypothetical protein